MLKRTDSAAMTKANVTMAYIRQECISLSYNCPRIGRTELYGGSVVAETRTPFSLPFVHLMAFRLSHNCESSCHHTHVPASRRQKETMESIYILYCEGQDQEVAYTTLCTSRGAEPGSCVSLLLRFYRPEPRRMARFCCRGAWENAVF